MIKRNIKDAFRNIPVAHHMQWLLGFEWKKHYYQETCLPFGLCTAPFIFNVFAEAFHWMLESFIGWCVEHYLDDFIATLSAARGTPERLRKEESGLPSTYGFAWNPRARSTRWDRNCNSDFWDRGWFQLVYWQTSSWQNKKKAMTATAYALRQNLLSLKKAQELTGFLSFCAKVVRLGCVFMRGLWNFIAKYPVRPSARRRIPASIKSNLCWWNTLLTCIQRSDILWWYKKANLSALHGCISYRSRRLLLWGIITKVGNSKKIDQSNAFALKTPNFTQPSTDFSGTTTLLPPTSRLSATTHSINVFEVQAILLAFQLFASSWKQARLIVNTDSATAFAGLRLTRLWGPPNIPLREIMLLASEHDILIEPQWIKSESNGLADAFSRFNEAAVADLCAHWQNPFHPMIHPMPLCNLFEDHTSSNDSSLRRPDFWHQIRLSGCY